MCPLKNLVYIIPIYLYYLIESLFLGMIVSLIWKIMFQKRFTFELSYFDFVVFIWVIKVLLFDIFKVNPFFTKNMNEENKPNNTEQNA